MFLKIHLLQVMSIGLITVPIKAQELSIAEVPELYMKNSDKALMNSIWNIAGFSSNQNEKKPDVRRKFFSSLNKLGPKILKSAIPHLGKIPGFPNAMKPVLPIIAGLIPESRRMIDLTGIKQETNTPTTIYSELDSSEENNSPEHISNRRALHLENADLNISDDNNKETNAKYFSTENLKTRPQDLKTLNLTMEQMKRMMQFQGVIDNIHNNKNTWNFWHRKTNQNINGGEKSPDTSTEVDIPSRSRKNQNPLDVVNIGPYHGEVDLEKNNSHIDYMLKEEYKSANTARDSKTSLHHPIGVSHKCAVKREESSTTSDKSPETSNYYEMLENNPMIHNFGRYNPIMNQHPNGRKTYLFQ